MLFIIVSISFVIMVKGYITPQTEGQAKLLNTDFKGPWTPTTWDEYPFAVVVETLHPQFRALPFECSGSILEKDKCDHGIILTAAHCVYNASSIKVWIGCTFQPCENEPNAVKYDAHMYTVHDNYNPNTTTHRNDIALIYLDCPIKTPDNAKKVYIPEPNDIFFEPQGIKGRVVSYGGKCNKDLQDAGKCFPGGGSVDTRLEYADFDFVDNAECSQNLSGTVGQFDTCFIDKNATDGQASICGSDSGAPIVYKNDILKQVSLVGWGNRTCDPQNPVVGPYLPYYTFWIRNMLLYFCTGSDANFTFDPTQFQCPTSQIGRLTCSDDDHHGVGPFNLPLFGRRLLNNDYTSVASNIAKIEITFGNNGEYCLCTGAEDDDGTGGSFGPPKGRRRLDEEDSDTIYYPDCPDDDGTGGSFGPPKGRRLLDEEDYCCCDCSGDDTGGSFGPPKGRRRMQSTDTSSCNSNKIGRYYGEWFFDTRKFYPGYTKPIHFRANTTKYCQVFTQYNKEVTCEFSATGKPVLIGISTENVYMHSPIGSVSGLLNNVGLKSQSIEGAYNQLCQVDGITNKCNVANELITDNNTGIVSCSNDFDCCLCGKIQCGSDTINGCDLFTVGNAGVYGVKDINIIGTQLKGATIECFGYEGCAESIIYGENIQYVNAEKSMSLRNAHIKISNPSSGFTLTCLDTKSCQGLNIRLVYSGPPVNFKCNPEIPPKIIEMGAIKCYGEESCKDMTLTIENEGCDIIDIQSIECIRSGACVNSEMNLFGEINVNSCQFNEQPPMGYALDTKCGTV